MSENNFKMFKVTFRLNNGQICVYNVTARSITEAQNSIIERLNSKGIKYTSVHCKLLKTCPITPATMYISD